MVVKSKSKTYYVQTDEIMKTQLLERGLADTELDLQEPPGELVDEELAHVARHRREPQYVAVVRAIELEVEIGVCGAGRRVGGDPADRPLDGDAADA
jgi:hypothetical protein